MVATAAYNAARDIWKWSLSRRRAADLQLVETGAKQKREGKHKNINTLTYRARVKNTGDNTAHGSSPRIYFQGIRPYDPSGETVDAELIVDTTSFWDRADYPSTITLHGEESEWVNIFRLVEDYRSGANFDPEEDRHIEFPSASGWNPSGDIQFKKKTLGISNMSKEISRTAVLQTYWQEARLRVVSDETSLEADFDFEDMNRRLDNSPVFNLKEN